MLFSKKLSIILRLYMEQNKITYNDTLFKEKRLTNVVSDMNTKIGIKGGMGINYFRYMSTQNVPDMTEEEWVRLARSMKHSVTAQAGYVRMKKTPTVTQTKATKTTVKLSLIRTNRTI